jgi:hypothetical protein
MISISTKNVKGNPKTTIVGVILFLASLVGFFALPEVGMSDMLMGAFAGLAFLGIKDPRKPNNNQ